MDKKTLYHFPTADKNTLIKTIKYFIEEASEYELSALFNYASSLKEKYYDNKVFLRGLIEFSSFCKNNCYYCGIRRSNNNAVRYRMSIDEIISCCNSGYKLGFRTFVLQSGEDLYFSDNMLCSIVKEIKTRFPDCAITLSVGEKSYESYKKLFDAGAERYLLRHETANVLHYNKLHPPKLNPLNRKECLYNLKEIGFQIGAGFMVGSPYQTYDTLAEDFIFLRELQPHMVGIGPFIPHKDTKFANLKTQSANSTYVLLALTRIMLPKSLIPATTALNTLSPTAREKGLLSGANVVMPNLTPEKYRVNYCLYDNKLCTGDEASENIIRLSELLKANNLIPDFSRGDHVDKLIKDEK